MPQKVAKRATKIGKILPSRRTALEPPTSDHPWAAERTVLAGGLPRQLGSLPGGRSGRRQLGIRTRRLHRRDASAHLAWKCLRARPPNVLRSMVAGYFTTSQPRGLSHLADRIASGTKPCEWRDLDLQSGRRSQTRRSVAPGRAGDVAVRISVLFSN